MLELRQRLQRLHFVDGVIGAVRQREIPAGRVGVACVFVHVVWGVGGMLEGNEPQPRLWPAMALVIVASERLSASSGRRRARKHVLQHAGLDAHFVHY